MSHLKNKKQRHFFLEEWQLAVSDFFIQRCAALISHGFSNPHLYSRNATHIAKQFTCLQVKNGLVPC